MLLCWVLFIFTIVISFSWIDSLIIMYCPSLSIVTVFILKSVLSHMCIATPAFFWFPFAWNIFFHPLTLSLYVFLDLKYFFCRQHIYRPCFCIHSASLCLLVEEFYFLIGACNLFTFKVIINMYVLIAILFWICFYSSFFLPFLFCFLCYLMTIFSVVCGFLFLVFLILVF